MTLTAYLRNGEKFVKITFFFHKNFYRYRKICRYEVRHFIKRRKVSGN
jgi:hypothetical protein